MAYCRVCKSKSDQEEIRILLTGMLQLPASICMVCGVIQIDPWRAGERWHGKEVGK